MIKFYVDSADLDDAGLLLSSGLFAGLTTNPTLLQRAGVGNDGIADLVRRVRDAGAREIFVQAWGADSQDLVDRGRWIRSLGDDVVVKVPATPAGLRATARLTREDVPVLVTAVYSAVQVLPVIASGARYVAPYLGRMNDAGRDGADEITTMQRVIEASGSDLHVLVASLRSAEDVVTFARAGVTHFTISPTLWSDFVADDLTTAAVEVFEAASAAG